jgi:hypothetical protein
MSTPKAQHILPRLSLEHFKDSRGQTWTYDKARQKRWSAKPVETGTMRHFYSFEKEDGTWDTSIEKLLSEVEDQAAAAYRAMAEGNLPVGEDRDMFAAFLAFMFARTPAMRRLHVNRRARRYEENMQAIATDENKLNAFCRHLANDPTYEGPTTKEEVRASLSQAQEFDLVLPKSMALEPLLHSKPAADAFLEMTWVLVQPKSHYFITTDSPVIVRSLGGDFQHPSTQVTFPISPKRLLLLEWRRKKPDQHGTMSKDQVLLENETRAQQSEQYLFSHIEDNRITKLAESFKSTRAGSDKPQSGTAPRFGGVVVPKKWDDRKDRKKTPSNEL